ncbi:serine/threonine-protein kinase [Parahaliea aestuarii]|uniref:Serine/threonine protein kinase n=1 Tax=Parahaliea aestuarii TaxID=1852021 RepID=A0A5C9A4R6_9GAMM|nr:serine/threonine-protein kinase [Parahaliea aestuarii]TXS94972.1 serine/threonine protein kinase [Parahaliea aestuarii]
MGSAAFGAPRIGPYRVLRLIRRGGQGSVYLGYDTRLQRRVAIKLYHLPPGRAERRKVVDEARIIAAIDSDRVVQIHDVILAGDYLAMIMAYVPGIDLEELLAQQGALELGALLSLATDVAAALAAVRQQGIVHGDLKASNVLVSDNGRAVLSDFGIARAPGRAIGVHGAASESALSPEHLSGEALDVRSDLFALGCLLYRMASGEHPFLRRGKLDVTRLREGDAPPLPDALIDGKPLPEGLRDLIQRLLQKSPADRPDNTHRVRQILRHLSHEQPQSLLRPPLAGLRSSLRQESEDDLPPALPQDFRRQGRSQLSDWRGFEQLTLSDVRRLLGRRRVQAAIGAVAVLTALLVALLVPRPYRVEMVMPRIETSSASQLPAGLSVRWLQVQVCKAALAQDGSLLFYNAPSSCPPAGQGVANNRQPPAANEQLEVDLHCGEELCLLGLARSGAGVERYRQAVLLPDMSLRRWQAVLVDLTRDSYVTR